MTVVIKVNVDDLDTGFIEEMREKYRGANLEIKVNFEEYSEEAEDWFWKIIGMLDWMREGKDDEVVEPVIAYLSEQPEEKIFLFQDILSEKLYRLDGEAYAKNMGEGSYGSNGHFSSDLFLYARCCVVANGKDFYQEVLSDPAKMPKDLTFEALLYLAEKAYRRKTGKRLDRTPAFIYETFFNPAGWGEKAIQI